MGSRVGDGTRFTFAFADLRGYGKSTGRAGTFTLREAAADVLTLADAPDWARFAIVGDSMSSLVALHLAQHHADRIERAVALTPRDSGIPTRGREALARGRFGRGARKTERTGSG